MPVTAAVRELRSAGVEYEPFVYDYNTYPGAVGAAEYIGVDPHLTAKTIVFVAEDGAGVVVLMHGDLEVSTKKVARHLGTKRVVAADQSQGTRITGYVFGGTSPLGMRTNPPVVAQATLDDLDRVYVNAGSRGFVVGINPGDLMQLTNAQLTDVAAE